MVEAIALKLKGDFGSTAAIYKEPVEQGMTVPCFFISLNNFSQKQITGKRYYREQRFTIRYVPGTVNKNAEVCDIADRLYDTLEYIAMDADTFRGSKMSCEVINGELHFYVNYNFYVYKETPVEEPMESIALDGGLKKE
ncbi:MAG TPA: hypothetical protein VHP38_15770 [Ruminiclostridium sp.]|nr:hypothetical protein [Ruminiclostridium sp.]